MPKFIFVTGGVVSSVGKGITTASLGRILKSRGISVSIQKLDPYLNVDPGTMSPYQHGEVFVTDDGAETDLDLGHYERFIDQDLTAASSVTSGQVYSSVLGPRAPRRLPRRHDPAGPAPHQRDQGRIYGSAEAAQLRRASSARSAAPSATSKARRSSKRSARFATNSRARTALASMSPSCRRSARPAN